MRALVDGLPSPHPLGWCLPPIYYEDLMSQCLTAGLDEVLAPVFSVLDNLPSYLDPTIAPTDFIDWLAGWVGLVLDETWPADRQRALVGQAAELFSLRGTVRGLVAHLGLYVEGDVEVEETGGATWSPVPGGAVPGAAVPYLKVRVRVADPATVDVRRLEAVVMASKPADVPHEIEVLRR
jgi:phage tail-like protein